MLDEVILFDLFDTLLDVEMYDIKIGTAKLLREFMNEGTDETAFYAHLDDFADRHFHTREQTNKEYVFKELLSELETKFGFRDHFDYDDIEIALFKGSNILLVNDKTRTLLEYYRQKGTPMYILSNSIFGAPALKSLLADRFILDYFEEVLSSADFGERKPAVSFFHHGVSVIQKKYPNIEAKQVTFIGNDYTHDIIGAAEAGLTPIYYIHPNWTEVENTLGVRKIHSFYELYRR